MYHQQSNTSVSEVGLRKVRKYLFLSTVVHTEKQLNVARSKNSGSFITGKFA